MQLVPYLLVILAAFLLGSVPTGYLVGKAKGIDIRTLGSGNIGATNVFRHLGKGAGAFVLLADALKGWLSVVLVAPMIAHQFNAGSAEQLEWARIAAMAAAVLGHNYTPWLGFKGGKGIATSAGVVLALVPASLAIILAVWLIVFAIGRYVSLASIAAAAALPVAAWATGETRTIILVAAGLAALAVYKHKTNIQRLLNGTEHRIGTQKAEARKGSGA